MDASNTPSRSRPSGLRVAICNRQRRKLRRAELLRAVREVLQAADVASAEISLTVVADPEMHELNRQYLEHDYPTDVLSFVLESGPPCMEGEIIVSTDTALRQSAAYGWPAEAELALYVIHGALHLVGYDDHAPVERRRMRAAERRHLAALGYPAPPRRRSPSKLAQGAES